MSSNLSPPSSPVRSQTNKQQQQQEEAEESPSSSSSFTVDSQYSSTTSTTTTAATTATATGIIVATESQRLLSEDEEEDIEEEEIEEEEEEEDVEKVYTSDTSDTAVQHNKNKKTKRKATTTATTTTTTRFEILENAKHNVMQVIDILQNEKEDLERERKHMETSRREIQERAKIVEKKEKWVNVMLDRVKQVTSNQAKVKLNIGGHVFITSIETLTKERDTFFSVMFNGNFNVNPDADGEYFIDREGDLFHLILRHLRGYNIAEAMAQLSESDRSRLALEAEFYGISSLFKYLRRRPALLEVKHLSKFSLLTANKDTNCQIATSPLNGDIYVSDEDNHRIDIFDCNGVWKMSFGSKGTADGEFNTPTGMAFNSKGDLIICDTNNFRIQMFDADLKHIRNVGSRGGRAGRFLTPTGVAIDSSDNIYVADGGNHRVQIFSPEGTLQRVIGSGYERQGWKNGGSEDGELNTPCSIAVGNGGKIYVSETCNHRVQVFSNDGKFLFKFGSRGDGESQFENPCHIILTDQGHLIVCDLGNHRLQIFDATDGIFLQAIKSEEALRPCAAAIGKDNNLIVSDSKGSSIHIFEGL